MPYAFNEDKSKYDLDEFVTGVKGDNESLFRTGNVNITKDHIGLGNVQNVKITSGTAAPSGGSDGDIYIQY